MNKQILMLLETEFPSDIRVEKEIKVLIQNGYNVILLTYTKKGSIPFEEHENLKIYRKPISNFIYKSSVGALLFPFYFRFWDDFIREVVDQNQVDFIHVHDLPLAKIGLKWSRKLSAKLILDFHENWPAMLREAQHTNTFIGKLLSWNILWRKYEKKIISKANAVITVADEMKDRLIQYTHNKNHFFVYQNVPELLDKYKVYHYNSPTESIKLVYLGGINKNRGIQTVIKAIKKLPDTSHSLKLTIIGTGPYLNNLKQLSEELNLTDRVFFTGHLPQQQAYAEIQKHHLAIIPHLRSEQTDNSSPNKLYQYMMVGLPVISSDCRSIERVIYKYNCGICYLDYSDEDLTQKLTQVINNKEKLNAYSKNAHNAILSDLNAETESKQLLNAYSFVENE